MIQSSCKKRKIQDKKILIKIPDKLKYRNKTSKTEAQAIDLKIKIQNIKSAPKKAKEEIKIRLSKG